MALVFLPPDEPGRPEVHQTTGEFIRDTVVTILFLASLFGALPLLVQSLRAQ